MVEALSSLMRRSNRDGHIQPNSIVDKLAVQHSVDAMVSFCWSDMLAMHIHMLRAIVLECASLCNVDTGVLQYAGSYSICRNRHHCNHSY